MRGMTAWPCAGLRQDPIAEVDSHTLPELHLYDHAMAAQAPDRGLPAPDVVIHLHLSPADAALRGGYGAERYEKVSLPI